VIKNNKHQIPNKFPCPPAPVPTESGAGRNDQNSKSQNIVFVIGTLVFEYYLGFGILHNEVFLDDLFILPDLFHEALVLNDSFF